MSTGGVVVSATRLHPMTEIIDYLRIEADPDESSESELLPTEDL
jgi:hypothetical protein